MLFLFHGLFNQFFVNVLHQLDTVEVGGLCGSIPKHKCSFEGRTQLLQVQFDLIGFAMVTIFSCLETGPLPLRLANMPRTCLTVGAPPA